MLARKSDELDITTISRPCQENFGEENFGEVWIATIYVLQILR